MSEQEPELNKELLVAVINQICQNPETHNQAEWHCRTQHCFAGWAQILSGKEACNNTASKDAQEACGLTDEEADWLFAGTRTRPEMHSFVAEAINGNRDGYNRNGYNRYGYNRDGYHRDGYHRDGYNRDGYHRDGYNRDGYDRDGYNQYGYDRYGYNRDGYHRDGYNRDGYNRDGYHRDGKKLPVITLS